LVQEEARRAYRESRRRAADITAGTAVRSFEHSVLRFESGVRFEGDLVVLSPPPRRSGSEEEYRELTWQRISAE